MKKVLALFLAVCLLACLAACHETQPGPALPEPPPRQGKTLVYWSMWNPGEPQAGVIREAAADYEEETGNRIQIEWKGRGIAQEILPALEAGEEIDLFDEDYMRTSKSYARYLLDLEGPASEAGYERFAIAALPGAVRGWAGSLVTIPYQPYTSGVFYSREAFERAGITGEPETWEEFLEVCQRLQAAGYTPLALDDVYACYLLGFHLARTLTQEGVAQLVAGGGWEETPGVLQAVRELSALREKSYLAQNAPTPYPAGQNEIGYGRAAMVVGASWIPGEVERATGRSVSWGMFNYPTVKGGKDPLSIQNVGAQSLSIPKSSQNAPEAFAFLMKLASGEYDKKLSARCGSIPADTRNTEWPPLIAGCRESFESLANIYEWNCGLDANKSVGAILQKNTAKLFEGTLTADQFVRQMEEESRAVNPSSKWKEK